MATCAIFGKHFLESFASRIFRLNQQETKVDRSTAQCCLNDIVLIVDENTAHNEWKLARVVEAIPSTDGLVRSVKLQLATTQLDSKGKRLIDLTFLDRPIHKLILLIEA